MNLHKNEWNEMLDIFVIFVRGNKPSQSAIGRHLRSVLAADGLLVRRPRKGDDDAMAMDNMTNRRKSFLGNFRLGKLQRRVAPEGKCPGGAKIGARQLGALPQSLLLEQRIGQKKILGAPQRTADRLMVIKQGVEERQSAGAAGSRVRAG